MKTKEIDEVLYKLVPEEKVDEPTSNSRLKPFNLEEAKAGKSICTRDGLPARIICFNRQGGDKPLVALIRANLESDKEHPACYTEKGEFSKDLPNCCHDLMMVE